MDGFTPHQPKVEPQAHPELARLETFTELDPQLIAVRSLSRNAQQEWILHILDHYSYEALPRHHKGILKEYVQRATGYSRAQVTRFIAQHRNAVYGQPSARTKSVYARKEVDMRTLAWCTWTAAGVVGVFAIFQTQVVGGLLAMAWQPGITIMPPAIIHAGTPEVSTQPEATPLEKFQTECKQKQSGLCEAFDALAVMALGADATTNGTYQAVQTNLIMATDGGLEALEDKQQVGQTRLPAGQTSVLVQLPVAFFKKPIVIAVPNQAVAFAVGNVTNKQFTISIDANTSEEGNQPTMQDLYFSWTAQSQK